MLIILFLGPLALTFDKSTPNSRATLLTDGEACAFLFEFSLIADDAAILTVGADVLTTLTSFAASVFLGVVAALITIVFSILATNVPVLTFAPSLTKSSFTVPEKGAGTSIVALSVSSVNKPSSSEILSPTATRTSITSTSPSSPISGTKTSEITVSIESSAGISSTTSTGVCITFISSTSTLGAAATTSRSAFPSLFIVQITLPSLILSPTFTLSSTNVPVKGAGISIDAFSVSTVIIASSSSKESPLLTVISIISTSSPPTSGNKISSNSFILFTLCFKWIYFFRVNI